MRMRLALLGLVLLAGCERAPVVPGHSEAKVRPPLQPKPLTGGTLLVSGDGATAFAADADRARLFVVDLASSSVTAEIALAAEDHPFRLAETPDGTVHLAMRGGDVVSVARGASAVTRRERACSSELRGAAYDAASDALIAVCARGELRRRTGDGTWVTTSSVEADARDLVPGGEGVAITRFRAAQLVSEDGSTLLPQTLSHDGRPAMEPAVAWRTVGDPLGGVWMLHQLASTAPVVLDTPDPPYAGITSVLCGRGVVHSALTRFSGGTAQTWDLQVAAGVLPVDLAVSGDGQWFGIAAAGSRRVTLGSRAWLEGSSACASLPERQIDLAEQPVAVAFTSAGELLVQTREPVRLLQLGRSGPLKAIELDPAETFHPGERRFHLSGFSGVTCASCHPEGGDDGRVWEFTGLGRRRTQALNLELAATAPYHWDGSEPELGALVHETLVQRMGDAPPSTVEREAMVAWLESLTPPMTAPATDETARGEQRFQALGCAGCHASSGLHDVGTGGLFEAPALRAVSLRTPLLHDGCAESLDEVFGRCGSGPHAEASALSESERTELLAFLRSL